MGFELDSAHRSPKSARAAATERMPETGIGAATSKLAATARAIDQSAGMPGVKIDLKQRERESERS